MPRIALAVASLPIVAFGLWRQFSESPAARHIELVCRRLTDMAFLTCRLATVLSENMLAVTGDLAVPGHTALSLLPASSAAGRCATSAVPILVETHAPSQR